jgi:hypothetical protein
MEKKYKYNSMTEFRKDNPQAYNFLTYRGLIEQLCKDMGWEYRVKKPSGYWTKERCMEEARKYTTKKDWGRAGKGSYAKSILNDWFDECVAHMIPNKNKPKGYWTKERCMEDALNYSSRNEWNDNSNSSYNAAKKNGWIEECATHMIKKINIWKDKERCLEVAKRHDSIRQWQLNHSTSYIMARKNGWFDECIAHMVSIKKPSGYWTKERCMEDALKYSTKTEWLKKNAKCYQAARRNGWVKECSLHMIELVKPKGYWTKERCIEEAKKYVSRKEWGLNSGGSYYYARHNNWIEECAAHMKNYGKKI